MLRRAMLQEINADVRLIAQFELLAKRIEAAPEEASLKEALKSCVTMLKVNANERRMASMQIVRFCEREGAPVKKQRRRKPSEKHV